MADVYPIERYSVMHPRKQPPPYGPTSHAHTNNRWLIVSNAPETWVEDEKTEHDWSGPVTLYRCEVAAEANTLVDFRCYLWHLNLLEHNRYIGIEATDLDAAGGLEVLDHRRSHITYGHLHDRGQRLAAYQLYGIQNALSTDYTSEDTLSMLFWYTGLGSRYAHSFNNNICSALHEFSVRLGAAGRIGVRVVTFRSHGEIGTPLDEPTSYYNTIADETQNYVHIRGSWPHCQTVFMFPRTLDVNPYLEIDENNPEFCEFPRFTRVAVADSYLRVQRIAYEVASGAHGLYGKRDDDVFGSPNGNLGLYGVDAVYRFALYNSHSTPARLMVSAFGRPTGEPFFGAGHLEPGTDMDGHIATGALYIPETSQSGEIAKIRGYGAHADAAWFWQPDNYVQVAPSQYLTPNYYLIDARIAVGGAAALPFDLVLSRHAVSPEEENPPFDLLGHDPSADHTPDYNNQRRYRPMRDTRKSQFANSLLNHVPVPYAINAFYGLEAFREALAHRGAADNGVDIVVIGSSLSAGAGAGASMVANWPHLLKLQLQEMLNAEGVGGYGFYPAVMDSNFDGTFAVSLGGAVETGAAVDADLRGCNDSALLIDERDGADIRARWFFDPAGRRNNRLWASTLELVFGAFDGGAVLTYDLNHSLPSDAYITPGAGGVTGTVDCDGSVTEAFGQRESIDVPTRGPLLLQVSADNAQGPGLVEGFIFYDGDEAQGVRVHNLSRYLRNFASTNIMTTLNRAAALDAFCGASGAGTFCKLVVIEGGAAEAVAGSSVALMQAKMEALIVRAQNASLCPSKPSVMLMIPPCPSGVTPDVYADYAEAIRSLGETYNCAVLDLFAAFHESGYGTWITSAGFNHGSLVTGFSAEFQRFVADVMGSVLLHGVAVRPAPLIRIGRGVAPPAATIGVTESEPETNVFTFTLTNAVVPLTDEAGVIAYGGLKFADLPAGAWKIESCIANLAVTKSSAGVNDDWDGDFAIGTVTASNNGTLSGTEANIVPSTATPQASAGATTAKGLGTASLVIDGTSTPGDLFVNFLVDDTDHDVTGTACNLILNGSIAIMATYLGDY